MMTKKAHKVCKIHAQKLSRRYMDKKSGFLFGGVGFVYKRNPKDQALAPDGRVWRA